MELLVAYVVLLVLCLGPTVVYLIVTSRLGGEPFLSNRDRE